jgi:DNA-binding response OmpR family regulator
MRALIVVRCRLSFFGCPQRGQFFCRRYRTSCSGPFILARREMTFAEKATVLIVDDDPAHLKLYRWVLQRGGFRAIVALVDSGVVTIPGGEHIDAAVLDYRLGPKLTAVDVAKRLRSSLPSMPILVLSDLPWMPDDVAPYASGFVRKGEPQQLIDTISAILGRPPES